MANPTGNQSVSQCHTVNPSIPTTVQQRQSMGTISSRLRDVQQPNQKALGSGYGEVSAIGSLSKLFTPKGVQPLPVGFFDDLPTHYENDVQRRRHIAYRVKFDPPLRHPFNELDIGALSIEDFLAKYSESGGPPRGEYCCIRLFGVYEVCQHGSTQKRHMKVESLCNWKKWEKKGSATLGSGDEGEFHQLPCLVHSKNGPCSQSVLGPKCVQKRCTTFWREHWEISGMCSQCKEEGLSEEVIRKRAADECAERMEAVKLSKVRVQQYEKEQLERVKSREISRDPFGKENKQQPRTLKPPPGLEAYAETTRKQRILSGELRLEDSEQLPPNSQQCPPEPTPSPMKRSPSFNKETSSGLFSSGLFLWGQPQSVSRLPSRPSGPRGRSYSNMSEQINLPEPGWTATSDSPSSNGSTSNLATMGVAPLQCLLSDQPAMANLQCSPEVSLNEWLQLQDMSEDALRRTQAFQQQPKSYGDLDRPPTAKGPLPGMVNKSRREGGISFTYQQFPAVNETYHGEPSARNDGLVSASVPS